MRAQRSLLLLSIGLMGILLGASSGTLVACGSRGPISDSIDDAPVSPGDTDASTKAETGLGPGMDASSLPSPSDIDTGIPALNCGICVGQKCGSSFAACLSDPSCQSVLRCIMQTCVLGAAEAGLPTGGGLDTACLLACGQKNLAGGLVALKAIQCVSQSCGPSCVSLLGTAGGFGGFP